MKLATGKASGSGVCELLGVWVMVGIGVAVSVGIGVAVETPPGGTATTCPAQLRINASIPTTPHLSPTTHHECPRTHRHNHSDTISDDQQPVLHQQHATNTDVTPLEHIGI